MLPTCTSSTLSLHTGDGKAASPYEEKTLGGNLVLLRSKVEMYSIGPSDLGIQLSKELSMVQPCVS